MVKIEDININEHEYIFEYGEEKEIKGLKVSLKDVDDDDLSSISVRVSQGLNAQTVRINHWKIVESIGLNITNIRINPRPISADKYAILRIE